MKLRVISMAAIRQPLQWAQQSPFNAAAALASASLVVVLTILWFRPFKTRKANKSPPSPSGTLPLIGNLHQLGGHSHRKLASMASRYGPLMTVRLGRVKCLIVSTVDAAREVMKTHDVSFSSRPTTKGSEALLYGRRDIATSPYGEHWRQARRVCVLHLLTAARLRQLHGVREGEVAAMLRKVEEKMMAGEAVNISTELLNVTNIVTSLVALGKSYWSVEDEEEQDAAAAKTGERVRGVITDFLKLIGAFNVADFIPSLAWVNWITGFDRRVADCAKRIDEWLEDEIQDRLRVMAEGSSGSTGRVGELSADGNNVGANFVDVLLSLEAAGNEGYSLFDRNTIKGILLDMFSAGTHTTSTVMDWTMMELMRHPHVRAKLTDEIRSSAGPNKKLVLEDEIENMPYLQCVVKEILRIHPPFPLLAPRQTIADVEVMGYHIPKGTMTMINAWAIQHDPKTWDRPDEFLPERFAESTVDYNGFHFELIPFGSGRRGCPGLLFAMQLTDLAIANLLYHYDWELPDGMEAADLVISEATGLTTSSNYSLVIKAKKPTGEAE